MHMIYNLLTLIVFFISLVQVGFADTPLRKEHQSIPCKVKNSILSAKSQEECKSVGGKPYLDPWTQLLHNDRGNV